MPVVVFCGRVGGGAFRASCWTWTPPTVALELKLLDVVEIEACEGVPETARVVGDLMERRQASANLLPVVGSQVRKGSILFVVGVLLLGSHGGVA